MLMNVFLSLDLNVCVHFDKLDEYVGEVKKSVKFWDI